MFLTTEWAIFRFLGVLPCGGRLGTAGDSDARGVGLEGLLRLWLLHGQVLLDLLVELLPVGEGEGLLDVLVVLVVHLAAGRLGAVAGRGELESGRAGELESWSRAGSGDLEKLESSWSKEWWEESDDIWGKYLAYIVFRVTRYRFEIKANIMPQ